MKVHDRRIGSCRDLALRERRVGLRVGEALNQVRLQLQRRGEKSEEVRTRNSRVMLR
jgi:hypothetical protein